MNLDKRRAYERNYYHIMQDKDFVNVKYIATDGVIEKKFCSRDEMAKFFGYNKDYILKVMKKGEKLQGWTIKRYKWYENIQDRGNIQNDK